MRLTVTLAALLLVASTAPSALPCSLVEGPLPVNFPLPAATLNANPVFFSPVEVDPTLERVGGESVALEVDDDLAGTFNGFLLTRAWRPVEPLTEGMYLVNGIAAAHGGTAGMDFFVDPELPLELAPLTGATVHVTLDEPEEGGCGAISSCDDVDFTKLEVFVSEEAEVDFLRLELTNPKTGRRRVELVAVSPTGTGDRSVLLWNNSNRWPGSFKTTRMCVSATPFTDDGAIGPTADLGCFDPDDDDPRVTDTRGCSTAGAEGSMGLWLGLLVVLRHRGRRLATR